MLYKYMELGGVLMWPILFCSVLLVAVVVERFWTLGIVGMICRRKLTLKQLTWHRRPVAFFIDVPPSLGLLGTVLGVVQSFNISSGRLSGEAIGAGLGVACLTTIFGLSVAIVASVMGHMLESAIAGKLPEEPATKATS